MTHSTPRPRPTPNTTQFKSVLLQSCCGALVMLSHPFLWVWSWTIGSCLPRLSALHHPRRHPSSTERCTEWGSFECIFWMMWTDRLPIKTKLGKKVQGNIETCIMKSLEIRLVIVDVTASAQRFQHFTAQKANLHRLARVLLWKWRILLVPSWEQPFTLP